MTSAVIYARISQDRDNEAVGVARQVEECQRYIEEHGWTLSGRYIDNNRSAMRGRRPEYERLLSDVGGYDVVVVWSSDRLYRRVSELERLVDALKGVRVVALKSGEVDLSTADGRAVARILGSLGQRESEKTAERVAAAARERAMQGRPHGGHRMYGFEPDGSVRPEEAERIRVAVARLDAGDSLTSVAKGLGMQTITLRRIVRNPRLVGMRYYRGEAVPGTGVAIVDAQAWHRVSARFAATGAGRPPTTLLSGILSCGECGGRMRAHQRSRDGKAEPAYRCFDNRCLGRKRAMLDSMVSEAVLLRMERLGARLAPPEPSATEGPAEGLRGELAALGRMVADGRMTALAYAMAAEPLTARIAELERVVPDPVGDEARDLLGSGDVRAAWDAAGVGVKRQIISLLVERVVVGKGRGAYIDVVWRVDNVDS